jgi:hemerythrin-like domain-containing protein
MLSVDTSDEPLTQFLRRDHGRIDQLFDDLRAMIDDGELERAEHHYGDAADALRRHIRIEEEVLFPAFETHTGIMGPTRVMCFEHRKIEDWLDELKQSLARLHRAEASSALGELLRILEQHNVKEESVLYPRAEAALSPEEQRELRRRAAG